MWYGVFGKGDKAALASFIMAVFFFILLLLLSVYSGFSGWLAPLGQAGRQDQHLGWSL